MANPYHLAGDFPDKVRDTSTSRRVWLRLRMVIGDGSGDIYGMAGVVYPQKLPNKHLPNDIHIKPNMRIKKYTNNIEYLEYLSTRNLPPSKYPPVVNHLPKNHWDVPSLRNTFPKRATS